MHSTTEEIMAEVGKPVAGTQREREREREGGRGKVSPVEDCRPSRTKHMMPSRSSLLARTSADIFHPSSWIGI
ncbi:hypothetical protein Mapa_012054 [Marchantia paleacea]|nr:hypothetical protein Mapa_012054 [Marchantia paleacea]